MLLFLIEKLNLSNIALAVQDWGGLLGLTVPMEMPARFERLLIMNTALGTGDAPLSEGFIAWRAYVNKNPDLDCGKLLGRACPQLSAAEAAAYEAPYPDAASKAGVRRFPNLVPDRPDAPGAAISRRARDWWRNAWQGEAFMAIGAKDPVLGPPVMQALRKIIRGCPEPYIHAEGGHFLQEWGDDVAREALKQWQ
jgi:haloalkane dehalogenase/tRNA(adenine34) deaminase